MISTEVHGKFKQAIHADDDTFTPPAGSFINQADDVHILVSKDGKTYRVRGAGEWKEFSAVDSDNPHP